MSHFIAPRDRDAWATIRGYVYQADLTIARWLDVEPGSLLELEHGEDIDIISQAITARNEEEQRRLLEQVKHRDSSVTLRTPAAIAALANFYEHRMANPDVSLLFRYTTNARIGHERPSPILGRVPALVAWEQLRTSVSQGSAQSTALDGIRSFLLEAGRPLDIHEDTWLAFRSYFQQVDHAQLLAFIQAFEWSTGTSQVLELRQDLKQRLVDKDYAIDTLEAEAQYLRLFLHVFETLSSPGIKQLRRENLERLLALPTLSATDHAVLETLHEMTTQLEQRLQAVEERVGEVEEGLANMSTQIHHLIREQGVKATVSYTQSTPVLDIPSLGQSINRRVKTVQDLKRIVTTRIWTAMYGGASTGKTTLASLLAHDLGTCKAWIRLEPDSTIEQACVQLDSACSSLMNEPVPALREGWYIRLASRLGRQSLVVLDDLPQLSGRDGLSERLRQLVQAFRSQGVHLVSTSVHELPTALRRFFPQQVLHSWAVPLFSHREAAELFQSYGAPEPFLPQAKFMNTLSRGHPLLLAATAQYLSQCHWQLDEQMVIELSQHRQVNDLKREVQQRLRASISDEHDREMLYRLSVILVLFSFEEARTVAAVNPELDHPLERLTILTGPWVDRDQQERFSLSPLVRTVGIDNLSQATRKDCNLGLAELMISRRNLHITEALSVLQYFLEAEDFNRAGMFAVSVLLDIQRQPKPVEDYGFVALWTTSSLPSQMDLGIRLYLRGVQLAIQSTRSQQTAYLEADLTTLLTQVTVNEMWAILAVWSVVRRAVPGIQLALLKVLQHWSQARLPDGELLSSLFPEDMHPESLIWASAQDVTNIVQLYDWMGTVELLTEEQRLYAFGESHAEGGCMHVVNQLWEAEAEKPKEQQDWGSILDRMGDIALRASHLQLELLWACAVRAKIMIQAEYGRDLTGALAVAEEALTQASPDPRVQFLLRECTGRQLLHARREQEARYWLELALSEETPAYPYWHMVAMLSLSRSIGSDDPHRAVVHAQEAVQLAEISSAIGDIALVKALGELAIAQWLVDDRRAAFEAWDRAADRLLECRVFCKGKVDQFLLEKCTKQAPHKNRFQPKSVPIVTRNVCHPHSSMGTSTSPVCADSLLSSPAGAGCWSC